MAGIDCVVHLAGIPTEAPWDDILQLNIGGRYNVFEAARRQGVKKVIFASSNHAVGFHRRDKLSMRSPSRGRTPGMASQRSLVRLWVGFMQTSTASRLPVFGLAPSHPRPAQ